MNNSITKSCPKCDFECESEDYESEYNDRTRENEESWSFTCPECGCEFIYKRTEKTTYEEETEVVTEGKPQPKEVTK